MLLTSFFVFLAAVMSTQGQTVELYHELSQQVFTGDSVDGSLFGYSINYVHYNNDKRLLVGSPKLNYTGGVYACDMTKSPCKRLPVAAGHLERGPELALEKFDFLLGATVNAGSDFILACAPRFAEKRFNGKREPQVGTFGRCFVQKLADSKSFEKCAYVSSDSIIDNSLKMYGYPKEDATNIRFELRMDSFGWSSAVGEDKTLVGGPAMVNGRVLSYDNRFESSPELVMEKDLNKIRFNLGYSVATGKFAKKSNYAISSTYGVDGYGLVNLYSTAMDSFGLKYSIKSERMGSLFGATLSTASLTNNGLDALLVGAPTFTQKSTLHDVGAVYVYTFTRTDYKLSKTLEGVVSGGYFGGAIASVGDLTGDKIAEIAISAPYESNYRGAVYLYSGADLLKPEEASWLQRIEGQKSGHHFGFSLTSLRDFDENGCNELAIGAPGSDSVTLLHCFTSVIIWIEAELPDFKGPSSDNSEGSSFDFNPCIILQRPKKPKDIENKIVVTLKSNHPSATLKKGKQEKKEISFEINLLDRPPKDRYCSAEKIQISLPHEGDYDIPLEFNITARLSADPRNDTNFNPNLVLLDEDVVQKILTTSVDRKSKLSLSVDWHKMNGSDYLIGSTDEEVITLIVSNEGYTAHAVGLRVDLRGVDMVAKPKSCQEPNGNFTDCSSPDTIKRKGRWEVELRLKTSSLSADKEAMSVDVELRSHDKKVKGSENVMKTWTLTHDSLFTLKGGKSEFAMDKNKFVKEGKKNLEHEYTITNRGVSTWKDLRFKVALMPYTESTVYVGSNVCEHDSPDVADCKIDKLAKNEIININVAMNILPGSPLIDKIVNKEVNLTTELTLTYDGKEEHLCITTSIELMFVATWIFIVAGLLALLIVALLIWALMRCGCLKRKNKEELEKLKQEVKRQTVRRSIRLRESMIEVIASQQAAEDQQCLMGSPENNMASSDSIANCLETKQQEIRAESTAKKPDAPTEVVVINPKTEIDDTKPLELDLTLDLTESSQIGHDGNCVKTKPAVKPKPSSPHEVVVKPKFGKLSDSEIKIIKPMPMPSGTPEASENTNGGGNTRNSVLETKPHKAPLGHRVMF